MLKLLVEFSLGGSGLVEFVFELSYLECLGDASVERRLSGNVLIVHDLKVTSADSFGDVRAIEFSFSFLVFDEEFERGKMARVELRAIEVVNIKRVQNGFVEHRDIVICVLVDESVVGVGEKSDVDVHHCLANWLSTKEAPTR